MKLSHLLLLSLLCGIAGAQTAEWIPAPISSTSGPCFQKQGTTEIRCLGEPIRVPQPALKPVPKKGMLTAGVLPAFVCDKECKPAPEPMVVAAVQVCKMRVAPNEVCPGDPTISDEEFRKHGPGGYRWACADPKRILLHSEDGSLHVCVRFEVGK